MNSKIIKLVAMLLLITMTAAMAAGCRSGNVDTSAGKENSAEQAGEEMNVSEEGKGDEAAGDSVSAAGQNTETAETNEKTDKPEAASNNDRDDRNDNNGSSAAVNDSAAPPAPASQTASSAEPENKPAAETGGTPAAKLVAQFNSEISSNSNIQSVANKLASNKILEFESDVHSVQEGFLNGFTDNITGFNSGVCIAPYIGSIPFIAYVFETDDASSLASQLKSKADLRWNVCTEADEMKTSISGNYVFFVMAPNSFE